MPAPHPSVEAMHGRLSSTNARLEDVGGVEQQLEPADGGAAAWKVLCATFVFEAVLFGEHPRIVSLWLAREKRLLEDDRALLI